jgi:hypothetical protein
LAKGIGSVCSNTEGNSLLELAEKSCELPGEISVVSSLFHCFLFQQLLVGTVAFVALLKRNDSQQPSDFAPHLYRPVDYRASRRKRESMPVSSSRRVSDCPAVHGNSLSVNLLCRSLRLLKSRRLAFSLAFSPAALLIAVRSILASGVVNRRLSSRLGCCRSIIIVFSFYYGGLDPYKRNVNRTRAEIFRLILFHQPAFLGRS